MKNKNTVTGLIEKYFGKVLLGAFCLSIILGTLACLWILAAEALCYGGTCISEFEGEIRTIDLFVLDAGTFCSIVTLLSCCLLVAAGITEIFFNETSEDDSANVCPDEDKYQPLPDDVLK